jgi:hypothetical protein
MLVHAGPVPPGKNRRCLDQAALGRLGLVSHDISAYAVRIGYGPPVVRNTYQNALHHNHLYHQHRL